LALMGAKVDTDEGGKPPLRTNKSVSVKPENKCRLMRNNFQLSKIGLSGFNYMIHIKKYC